MLGIVLGVWMVDFFMVGLDLERISVIGPKQGYIQTTNLYQDLLILLQTLLQEIAGNCHI